MARDVDADALGAGLVWEHLDKRVLTLVLQDEGLVVDQVIAKLARLVDQEEEGVRHSNVRDGRIPVAEWEPHILLALILDQMEGDFAI